MKNNLQDIIKFYRDCYQLEYSTGKVNNFYSSSVTNLYYPETFKLLSQNEYQLPVKTLWGEKVTTELNLGSSEKKLICGSFFIKGKIELLGKSHKLFTPLFINDVILNKDNEIYSIEIDKSSTSLNPIAINYLNSIDKYHIHKFEYLMNLILNENDIYSFAGLNNLYDILKEKYPFLDIQLILERIKSNDPISKLKIEYSSRKLSYVLFPDILIGLIDKPKKSRNVINELTDLSKRNHKKYSILESIFNDVQNNKKEKKVKKQELIVPVSLSESQKKILTTANKSKITMVIGPPGTGKSFSIAALAIQAFSEGKSVLIASKNEQACQVIYNKIEKDIGIKNITVNSSKARFRRTVSSKLRNIANGIGVSSVDYYQISKKTKEIQEIKKNIKKLALEISKRESHEKNWGEILAKEKLNIFNKIKKGWIEYNYGNREHIWDLKYSLHELNDKLQKKEKYLIKLIYKKLVHDLLKNSRTDLLKFEEAFREKRGNIIKEIFSKVDFNIILEVLPIWICKSVDIANIIPLKEDVFDLLIIDEASQCDISSTIPLIYRSKAITIVGDPNQLKHISFLSKLKENQTRKKYNISSTHITYRDKSILDLVNESINSQEKLIFLNEHFRSMPDIINFPNHEFYSGQLKIMTDHLNENNYNNLNINYLEKGKRNEKGENIEEVNQIINSIKVIINDEINQHKDNCSSIGVISPFRNQVNLIKKQLKREINTKSILKHNILIGTPYSFQGEEKDIIFLSFTIDKFTHQSVLKYLENPNVFNVSITRAKNTQEVYISRNPNELNSESLLSKYLTSNNDFKINEQNNNQFYDSFLKEVFNFINNIFKGKILIDRKICGTKIDLVLVSKNKTIGIDLVGYPGDYTSQLSIEEIMSLERAKINLFLLPFSNWYFEKEVSKTSLKEFIIKFQ